MTMRDDLLKQLAELEAEFGTLSDDELRAERLKWKELTPQYQAADKILKSREKERDPTGKILSDLATRVANIEKRATEHESRTWAFWISIAAAIIAFLSLLLAGVQSCHGT